MSILSGIAGAVGSLFGGGNKSTTQTAPWKPVQPALKGAITDARQLYEQGGFRTDPYSGQRVAPYSAMTNRGIDMLGQHAR